MTRRTRVAIVVERDFGDKLLELSRSQHVWIADTDANRAAAELVWKAIASITTEGSQRLKWTIWRQLNHGS